MKGINNLEIYYLPIPMDIKYTSLIELIDSKKFTIDEIKASYLALLSMLTDAPTLTNREFVNQVFKVSKMGEIRIAYEFDIEKTQLVIIGSGTIIYEPKLIHGGSYAGHIEDIVVHEKYRGMGIALTILQELSDLGKKKGCYKIILDCKSDIEKFYEKNGFEKRGIQMAKYFTANE